MGFRASFSGAEECPFRNVEKWDDRGDRVEEKKKRVVNIIASILIICCIIIVAYGIIHENQNSEPLLGNTINPSQAINYIGENKTVEGVIVAT